MPFAPNTDLYRRRIEVADWDTGHIICAGILARITSPWDFEILKLNGETITVSINDSSNDIAVKSNLITLYISRDH